MIVVELLGVGTPGAEGGWLLHRVCARFRHGEVTLVVWRRAEERRALLDAVTAKLIPTEGRVWVRRIPLMPDTLCRVRALVADVDLAAAAVEHRSLFWNVLAAASPGYRTFHGLLRLPRRAERDGARRALELVGLAGRATELAGRLIGVDRARLALAGALVGRPAVLVIREADWALEGSDADAVRRLIRTVARSERVAVLAGATAPSVVAAFADRIIALADGRLVFDGPPADFASREFGWRFETA